MRILGFIIILILFAQCNKSEQQFLPKSDTLSFYNIKPNDKKVIYYENGQIKFIQEYYNGLKHGVYKNWYENGIIRTLGYYYMGFRKGLWTWYNERGEVEFQVNYDTKFASF